MVRHSRERALSDREFERLLQGIERIDCDWYRLQTRFVVLVAGRLGMRAGEIAHMREDWVDFRSGMIRIPEQDICDKGEDGGPCGYCRSLAQSVVKHAVPSLHDARLELLEQGQLIDLGMGYQELLAAHRARDDGHVTPEEFEDRVEDALALADRNGRDGWEAYDQLQDRAEKYRDRRDVTLDEALEQYWIPKTDAAAREIPFDFDARAEIVIEDFFDRVDRYPTSRTTVNRRVDDALEAAGMDTEACSPHGLRATAASHHAGRGLDVVALQSMFGWVQLDTAMKYIQASGTNTQRALNAVHSR